jgi:hypothetical protein
MKVKITQSRDTEWVDGVTAPPRDGKCQACDRQTHGYWGERNKQGLFICHYCKQGK